MSDERLAQIRARLAAMYAGSWAPDEVVESHDWALGLLPIRDQAGDLVCLLPNYGWPEQRANAAFIANAPADVEYLLAALDAATARLAELERFETTTFAGRTPEEIDQARGRYAWRMFGRLEALADAASSGAGEG